MTFSVRASERSMQREEKSSSSGYHRSYVPSYAVHFSIHRHEQKLCNSVVYGAGLSVGGNAMLWLSRITHRLGRLWRILDLFTLLGSIGIDMAQKAIPTIRGGLWEVQNLLNLDSFFVFCIFIIYDLVFAAARANLLTLSEHFEKTKIRRNSLPRAGMNLPTMSSSHARFFSEWCARELEENNFGCDCGNR